MEVRSGCAKPMPDISALIAIDVVSPINLLLAQQYRNSMLIWRGGATCAGSPAAVG